MCNKSGVNRTTAHTLIAATVWGTWENKEYWNDWWLWDKVVHGQEKSFPDKKLVISSSINWNI